MISWSSLLPLLLLQPGVEGRADWSKDRKCLVLLNERVDCGVIGISAEDCRSRGCCWNPAPHNRPGVPWCFKSRPIDPHYDATPIGVDGNQYDLYCPGACYDQGVVSKLRATINYQPDTVHIDICGESSVSVPSELYKEYPGYPMPEIQWKSQPENSQLVVTVQQEPFQFSIKRRSDQSVIFDTRARNELDPFDSIIMKSHYIEIGTVLPRDHYIYGLGERAGPFRKSPGRMALHAHDTPAFEGRNSYGAHPFYLEMRPGGIAHGVLMLNSHPMEIQLTDDALVYRMLGGNIDLFVFAGPTADDVIEQYTRVIGRPALLNPRFLGLHQCRFGYKKLADWKEVVAGYEANNLPLDGIWLDIDYMDERNVGTVDPINYPLDELRMFIEEQHEKGRLVVPIIDPGITVKPGSGIYEDGLADKVFLRSPHDPDQPYSGKVWPGLVHFVDFLAPKAGDYWRQLLRTIFDQISSDGIWIDMNEPAAFDQDHWLNPQPPHPSHQTLNYPPFAINTGGAEDNLFAKTIPMDVIHHDVPHIARHNVYGFSEAMASANALEVLHPNERHSILARSTFPGSGRFAAHWLGDNFSDFSHMKLSIAGIMDFQLFGIPMVGADICGFLGTTEVELCARWMALGSFYPFARNHNAERPENIPQEPFRWPLVAEVTREYYALRYSLLPYWYTLFRQAHETGRPVIRPMFFEFGSLQNLWANDEQFMVGPAILVAPVLKRGAEMVQVTFPPAVWYDLNNLSSPPKRIQKTEVVDVDAGIETIPVFLRGGHILLRQEPGLTIKETIDNDGWLLVALDEGLSAQGTVYFDDGVSSDPGKVHTKLQMSVTCSSQGCILRINGNFGYHVKPKVRSIVILSPTSWGNPDRVHNSLTSLSITTVMSYRIKVDKLEIDLNQASQHRINLTKSTKPGKPFTYSSF